MILTSLHINVVELTLTESKMSDSDYDDDIFDLLPKKAKETEKSSFKKEKLPEIPRLKHIAGIDTSSYTLLDKSQELFKLHDEDQKKANEKNKKELEFENEVLKKHFHPNVLKSKSFTDWVKDSHRNDKLPLDFHYFKEWITDKQEEEIGYCFKVSEEKFLKTLDEDIIESFQFQNSLTLLKIKDICSNLGLNTDFNKKIELQDLKMDYKHPIQEFTKFNLKFTKLINHITTQEKFNEEFSQYIISTICYILLDHNYTKHSSSEQALKWIISLKEWGTSTEKFIEIFISITDDFKFLNRLVTFLNGSSNDSRIFELRSKLSYLIICKGLDIKLDFNLMKSHDEIFVNIVENLSTFSIDSNSKSEEYFEKIWLSFLNLSYFIRSNGDSKIYAKLKKQLIKIQSNLNTNHQNFNQSVFKSILLLMINLINTIENIY
ncbi:hypothetical protein WICMUC_004469 [Wickerhamomyces mucosus]|uniref:Uncharacterized protein n=1 Tax=Wickerhamomyces mucosus TaxID=1378264 RepID=A0A9P8PH12_9ASCO|nr:hypothetical protein WICMUC_004469 [Wickerhamomyces mucosus]